MGDIINIGAKPCTVCGMTGGHRESCTRHPDRMRRLAQDREERYRTGELERPQRGSAKRLRTPRDEARELVQTAAQMLYGDRDAAVSALRKQLKSKDERIVQRAALEILAYTDGKPKQTIEQNTNQVTEVIYRSTALMFEGADEPPADLRDVV